MIKVFYDDKCGICIREIEYYKKISSPETFDWCPLSLRNAELNKFGINFQDSLKSLHVVTEDGAVKTGIDAFIVMWRQMARWRWLAAFVSLPVIYQFSRLLYLGFSRWRFKRLNHCEIR